MDYRDFYAEILCKGVETGISSDNHIELSDRGYGFLQNQIEKLNKKAVRWGVAPMELKVIKEEFKKEKNYDKHLHRRKGNWSKITRAKVISSQS